MPAGSGPRILAALFLAAQAGAAWVFGFLLSPASPFYPRCVFHLLTGLHCPGCGTGRALRGILEGRGFEALGHNILLVPGLLLLVAVDVDALFTVAGKSRPLRPERIPGLALVSAAVILAFWILRNLPWFPFTLLAP